MIRNWTCWGNKKSKSTTNRWRNLAIVERNIECIVRLIQRDGWWNTIPSAGKRSCDCGRIDWLYRSVPRMYVCMRVCVCFGKRVLISWLKAEEFKQGRVCAATLTFYCHEKTSERSFSFTHDDPSFPPVSPNDKVWAMWWNVTLGWTHGVGPRWTTKVTIGHVIRYESRGPKKGNHRMVQLRIYIYIQPTSERSSTLVGVHKGRWYTKRRLACTRGEIIDEAFVSLLLFCLPMSVIRTFGASLCIL